MYKISWHNAWWKKKKPLSNCIICVWLLLNFGKSWWKWHQIEILAFNMWKKNNFHSLLWKLREMSLYLYLSIVIIYKWITGRKVEGEIYDCNVDSNLLMYLCVVFCCIYICFNLYSVSPGQNWIHHDIIVTASSCQFTWKFLTPKHNLWKILSIRFLRSESS